MFMYNIYPQTFLSLALNRRKDISVANTLIVKFKDVIDTNVILSGTARV